MQLLEVTWSTVRPYLELYERLPLPDRRTLLKMQGSKFIDADGFGSALAALVKGNCLRFATDGQRVAIHPDARPFFTLLRAADRCPVLFGGEPGGLRRYIQAEMPVDLRSEVLGDLVAHGDVAGQLAKRIATVDWIASTLDSAACRRWQRLHAEGYSDVEHVYTPEVRELLEKLVDALVDVGPVPLVELAGVLGAADDRNVDRTLTAALRYLVGFPGIDPDRETLVIGLHPGVASRLAEDASPAPVVQEMDAPVLPGPIVGDLQQVLVAVGGTHVRIRADGELFKKDADRIAESLPDAPDHDVVHPRPPSLRVEEATRLGRALDFIEVGPDAGGRKRLVATGLGRAWVASRPPERLRYVLERVGLRRDVDGDDDDDDDDGYDLEFAPRWRDPVWGYVLASAIKLVKYGSSIHPLGEACRDILRSLPREGVVSLSAFIAHAARERNPLLGQGPFHEAVQIEERRYGPPTSTEAREAAWEDSVLKTLQVHLGPWGGLRLRLSDDERDTWVGLSDLGAWLVGITDEFPAFDASEAHVVVQPTFEVVFLMPDLETETELSAFCDRIGKSVGAVFRITKASVLRGASAGVPLESILETLTRVSRTPLPGNVKTEIETWHGRQRVLQLRRPWVLDCGDAETANRVLAAAPRKLERISDHLLALRGSTKPETIAKALAEHGVTLDTSDVPQPRKKAARRRSRRRW